MTSKTRMNQSRRALLFAMPAVLALAGCGSLLGGNPPPKIYVLAPSFGPVDAQVVNWQLSVVRPDAADIYDTERLAIARDGIMDYYADAQWTDQTEPLFQRLIVEGFEKSGRIQAVGREREGLHADVLLEIEVRNFVARYSGADGVPTADVELVAKLVTPDRRMVTGTLDSHHQVAATANSIPAAVAAFNTAAGQAIEEIVAWTLRNGEVSAPSGNAAKTLPFRHPRRHR